MGEGVVKDGSGVMFVIVYYCLSFEAANISWEPELHC